jgi:hypothetical protein
MSGEIEADVADSYRVARKSIESTVNQQLTAVGLQVPKFNKWAFLAIIRREDHPDYDEVARVDTKRGVLEFRFKIPHDVFKGESIIGRQVMLIASLRRSIDEMEKFGVSEHNRSDLREVLADVELRVQAGKDR